MKSKNIVSLYHYPLINMNGLIIVLFLLLLERLHVKETLTRVLSVQKLEVHYRHMMNDSFIIWRL